MLRRILIIGATSGIGKQLADIYISKGCLVAITGRRSARLDELKKKNPSQIFISCFDVTAFDNTGKIDALIDELGGLDLLIYNAGLGLPSDELVCENEMTTTKTLVTGFVEVSAHVFNYFVKQGYGQIALTSSVAGLRGSGKAPAYSAGKAFMSNYAEGLNIKANRLKKNIVITDIRPGFVQTKNEKFPGRFWVATTEKAVSQIVKAIERKKKVIYITRRWWLVAQLMKILPYGIWRKLG